MPYYFRPLQDQLDYLDHLINEVSSALADRPPGHIIVQHNHGCPQYYYKQNRSDRHGVYIRNANRSFIASVLQKEYETEFIKFAQKQRITLCRFQEQNTVRSASLLYHALATPYEKLSPDRKNLIKPYVLSDDAFIDSWLQVTYERKAFYSGEPVILTGNGTRVRSKSEKIIAECISAMPSPDREIFISRFYFEKPISEIARELGLSERRVEYILAKDKRRLRKALIKGGILL